MNTQLFHFDTYFATKNTGVAYISTSRTLSSNCNLVLTAPIKKVKKLSLKSLEIPYVWSNIRRNNDSNHLTYSLVFTDNSTATYRLYINEGNYTLVDLLTQINSQNMFDTINLSNNSVPTAGQITFYSSIDSWGNTIVLIKCDATVKYITFPQSILTTFILGLNPTYQNAPIGSGGFLFPDSTYGSYVYGNNPVNIVPDTFICLNITNIPSYSTSAHKNIITFKIPFINSVYNSLFQYVDTNYIKQTVNITDANFNLSNLNIQVTDRFGFLLNIYHDFSFTLEIQNN